MPGALRRNDFFVIAPVRHRSVRRRPTTHRNVSGDPEETLSGRRVSKPKPWGCKGHPAVGLIGMGPMLFGQVTLVLLGMLLFFHCASYTIHVISKMKVAIKSGSLNSESTKPRGF